MRISSFRVQNYKSFTDSGEIHFSEGFNVIIGANNVGKTALLEALSCRLPGRPHRSLKSKPQPSSVVSAISTMDFTFSFGGSELKQLLLENPKQYYLPMRKGVQDTADGLLESVLGQPEVSIKLRRVVNPDGGATWTRAQQPSYGGYETRGNKCFVIQVTPGVSNFQFAGDGATEADFGLQLAQGPLIDRIYFFQAERFRVGLCTVGHSSILRPDASNLPEVLDVLHSNPARFRKYNDLVRKIFPTIYEVSVRPKPGNVVEVTVWTEDPSLERADLPIELAESGTGVGQALAILYVALNSDSPMVLLIDEPNSFLHPAAARKLIEILKQFPKHQYIVATHSAEILRAANPATLILVRWDRPQSVIEQLDVNEITSTQRCLVEVGAKLSDVFGADDVLWVEGQTEEECFKLILSRLVRRPLLGTSIVALRNTGDLQGKHAQVVLHIYKRLSQGSALIPPAVGFLLDREDRSPELVRNMERQADGKMRFLPRRTYENYLIHPGALVAVMNELPTFQGHPMTQERIIAWLQTNAGKSAYIDRSADTVNIADEHWLAEVHGARLLSDCFTELSNSQEEYRKLTHSIKLTEWLIDNEPSALSEVAALLNRILEGGSSA